MVMLWLMRLSRAEDENIVKATNSEIKSTNINIKGKRRTYYISDILEVRKPDGEPEEVTSRLGDYFGKLKTFLFGALQSPDFFSTRPIVADTDIYFILSEYKDVEIKFDDNESDYGKVYLELDGLVVPNHATTVELKSNGKPSAEQLEASGVYTKFKPNKIKYFDNSVIKDDFVAFRMWDKPTFTVQPNAGYYIKKVVVEAENPTDNTWKEIMDLRNLPDTPDVLGARDLTIDGVTTNIRITVDFEEKPSEKSLWD